MQIIRLDASGWEHVLDFYDALLKAIGAPEWHGRGIDALLDTMVWADNINTVKPPFAVVIKNAALLDDETLEEIRILQSAIEEARVQHQTMHGRDVDVSIYFEAS